MPNQRRRSYFIILFSLLAFVSAFLPSISSAAAATEINIGVNETLKRFRQDVPGGSAFLKEAKGVLVFPKVLKAGFWIGGEYGEGALVIDGETRAYYNTAAASIGLQAGAQSRSIVLVFLTNEALIKFQRFDGWKVGVDGSIAFIEWGTGENINTIDINDPIVGFVFSNKGLMVNLTLEGSKFSKIIK
ncbi:MAG: lipid-binding SYLF domain-containing protein [Methylophagaceae bacterium]|jgi:lipid-binding SYLF domain-containing protein